MRLRFLPLLFALTALFVAGCDFGGAPGGSGAPKPTPAPGTSTSAYERLLAGEGGIDGVAALLDTTSDAELRRVLSGYEMGLDVRERLGRIGRSRAPAPAAAQSGDDVTECPRYIEEAGRQTWIRLKGAGGSESHYIDGAGRPLAAYKRLPPDVDAGRSSYCQAKVGNFGNPDATWDGGHLIGSQLGGWGKRANLAPQHYNFNRSNWVRVENQLAECDGLDRAAVEYYVTLDYPSSSGVVPDEWTANVSIYGSPWANAYFDNAYDGGSGGDEERARMVSWLKGKGCD